MVYVPGVEAPALMTPVDALIDKPFVLLKLPPVVNPVVVLGEIFPALAQTGVEYVKVVTGVMELLRVIWALLLAAAWHALAAIV